MGESLAPSGKSGKKSAQAADLDPDLLRGFPFRSCLSGTGGHWCHPDSPWRPSTSTQRVKRYDVFFSHEWKSGRWSKHLSLLVTFNGLPAAIAGFGASLAMGVLGLLGVLPESCRPWLPAWGYAVSLAVFFFWQHVRQLFVGPKIAFLDSVCIPQDDEVLKARCIQGLGTFLKRSEQLVVLWSPGYFRRVWCSYEIGFFLLETGQAKMIQFVPVQIGHICACLFIGVSLFQATVHVVPLVGYGPDDLLVVIGIIVAVLMLLAILVFPVLWYTLTAMLRDLSQLPTQVRDFRVQDAECTCCTQEHCHPVTQAPIACDRELIYKSLRGTFVPSGHEQMGEEAALDAFNGYVRETLARSIDRNFRHHNMILRHALVTCATACGPWASLRLAHASDLSTGEMVAWLGGFLYGDLVLFCLMRVSLLIGHFGVSLMERYPRPVIVLGQVAMFGVAAGSMLFPWPLAFAFSRSGPYPWLWPSILAALACVSGCFLRPAFSTQSGTPVLQRDPPSTSCGSEAGPGRSGTCDEDEESSFEI
ncbi:AND1 [Symbiodinium sp. CCMP2592]|nr:AND1 [Symbiodinium sp. CCMP2592]